MSGRYHRAAQDGYLEVLREATKKDCNTKDEDGMTPTLWSAFEGNLDALRLLCGRGGDPERCDNFGNTALHLASARGHMNCVTFLVNFGVNMHCLDIDMHTPQELAAMNDCTDILRYLDGIASKQELEDPKKVKKQQEAAEREAQRLIKNFKEIQKKADKKSKKKEKDIEQEIRKMEINVDSDGVDGETANGASDSAGAGPIQQTTSSMSFSDMVGIESVNSNTASVRSSGSSNSGSGGGGTFASAKTPNIGKGLIGTVFKKSKAKKATILDTGFKVRDVDAEDGKMKMKKVSGLRRDSEIMFARRETEGDDDVGGGVGGAMGRMSSSTLGVVPGNDGIRRASFGIFDRAGFGTVTFRRDSMAATLFAVQNDDSIGSTGDREFDEADEEEGEEGVNGHSNGGGNGGAAFTAIDMFLAGLGLSQYSKIFRKHQIDLEALTLLDEANLLEMKIEIGPRKKILKAIDERRKAMAEGDEADGPMEDSRL